jgi:hypothetical protein
LKVSACEDVTIVENGETGENKAASVRNNASIFRKTSRTFQIRSYMPMSLFFACTTLHITFSW